MTLNFVRRNSGKEKEHRNGKGRRGRPSLSQAFHASLWRSSWEWNYVYKELCKSRSPPKELVSSGRPPITELVLKHPCTYQSIHSMSSKNTLTIANILNGYRADNHASHDILSRSVLRGRPSCSTPWEAELESWRYCRRQAWWIWNQT